MPSAGEVSLSLESTKPSAQRPTPRRSKGHALWPLLRLLAVGAALYALVHFFLRGRDIAGARALVAAVGWPLALALLPTSAALAMDALGWRRIVALLGYAVPWRRMLELRLAVEALVLALPGGSLAGEVAKLTLLSRRTGVPRTKAAASLALTKACLITTDAAYLGLAALWAAAPLTLGRQVRSSWPALLAAGGAALTAVVGTGMFVVLREASVATRLAEWLGGLGISRVRRWVETRTRTFAELDAAAGAFFAASSRQRARCLLPFGLEWLIEGIETILILKLLGVRLGIGELLIVDAVGSLLRVLVFFVPAGLGVQDAAVILLLRTFGVESAGAVGAAFIVIKRTKEVFWIAVGASFLAVRRDLWSGNNDAAGAGGGPV